MSILLGESHVPQCLASILLLTLSAHTQEGYGTFLVDTVCLFVCVSVCYHLIVNIVRFYSLTKVHVHVCTALF